MRKLLAAVLLFVGSQSAYSAESITMGIVPQQSPLKLFKVWKPITNYLSKELGVKVDFKTEKSIAEFEKVLYSGGYDIAYMNPYHFVVANRKQDYQTLVRAKKMIRGILVADQKVDNFESLVQKPDTRFIFPSPNAFAATLLTKFELHKKFGVDIEAKGNFKYVNSHDSVYTGVARGTGDVGGGIQRTYNNYGKTKEKEQLNVIYTTDAYPSHPIAHKPDMDKELKEKLAKALLNIPDELISRLSIKELIPIENEEYKPVQELEKSLFVVKR